MQATATVDGDEVVLNGRKWWSTGIGASGLSGSDLHGSDRSRGRPASSPFDGPDTVLNSPGVKIERMLTAMGMLDAPYGHGEVSFTDVRLPVSAIIAGPGKGFEIAQGRLGPGRIHHCMRLIGLAEMALELGCRRALEREAFGRPLAKLGGNAERIADARIAIEQAASAGAQGGLVSGQQGCCAFHERDFADKGRRTDHGPECHRHGNAVARRRRLVGRFSAGCSVDRSTRPAPGRWAG